MYLDVQPSGSRSWIQRIAIRGRELGVGGFPVVSLQEARAKALANRRLARAGGDPLAEKRRAQDCPPSPRPPNRVWTQLQPGWRHAKHRRDWLTSLTRYAFPSLGKQPVSEITSADVLDTLRPIWHTQPDMARRVRQRIRASMEWAIVMQYRADNPCDRIGPALGRQQVIVQHIAGAAPCPGRGGAAGAYHARGQARF